MKRMLPLLFALMLLACVPTPSEEAIVNKSDGSMVQAIAAPKAEAARYEAPAHWEETERLSGADRPAARIHTGGCDRSPQRMLHGTV